MALQRLADQVGRQPSLLLAGASVTVMVVAGMALAVLGLWNQSQQAIRQERNMLLTLKYDARRNGMQVPALDRTRKVRARTGRRCLLLLLWLTGMVVFVGAQGYGSNQGCHQRAGKRGQSYLVLALYI